MGRKVGSVAVPWTEAEKAAVRADLDAYPQSGGSGRVKRLTPLLPGRVPHNIHNALNSERRRREGLCHCGSAPPLPGRKTCGVCSNRGKKRRRELLAKGFCTHCQRRPIGDGGSATVCQVCTERRRRDHAPKDRRKSSAWCNKQQVKCVSYNLVSWMAAKVSQFMVDSTPKGSMVVDLFGGSGDIAMRSSKAGHTVLAYNDAHPMLVAFIRTLQAGHWEPLVESIRGLLGGSPDDARALYQTQLAFLGWWLKQKDRERQPSPPGSPDWQVYISAAAALYVVARSVRGRDMTRLDLKDKLKPFGEKHRARMREAQGFLEDVEVTCLDFAEAIDYHDSLRTLFIADPPWPGSQCYEHGIRGRHQELVGRLMDASGRFILVMQSTRSTMEAMQHIPHLYWKTNFGGSKVVVGSDFPLEQRGLSPIDLSKLGYLNPTRVTPRASWLGGSQG